MRCYTERFRRVDPTVTKPHWLKFVVRRGTARSNVRRRMGGGRARIGVAGVALMLVSTAPPGRAASPQSGGATQSSQAARRADVSPDADARALLNRYCIGCHSEAARQAGAVPLALDTPNLSDVGASARV